MNIIIMRNKKFFINAFTKNQKEKRLNNQTPTSTQSVNLVMLEFSHLCPIFCAVMEGLFGNVR